MSRKVNDLVIERLLFQMIECRVSQSDTPTSEAMAFERPDWRVVAGALGPRVPAGGRAILVQHYRDLLPLSLYEPGLKFWPGRAAIGVRELDIVSFTSPPSAGFCWWGSACNLWPSRTQPSYPVAGFHAVSERRALQFTILRMAANHPRRVTQGQIKRAIYRARIYFWGTLRQRS